MFHDINFSLSSVGALLLFYIAEQKDGTSQRIDRANAARAGRVCARWWAFHAAAAPKTPNLLELVYLQRGSSPHTQEHTRRHPRTTHAQPCPLHAKRPALRKRHPGKANHRPHETAHQTRSPLAHAESFARKNNTAPTNEGIRRGSVESFGAQCTQKIGKVRTQSR